MNRKDLVLAVQERCEEEETLLTRREINTVIGHFLDVVSESIAENRRVTLVRFGTFTRGTKKSRPGRNPSTGEPIEIPKKFFVKFQPGKDLKLMVRASD